MFGQRGGADGRIQGHVGAGAQTPKARFWRSFFAGIWLVYLVEPTRLLFDQHRGAAYMAGGLAIVAAFCVVYIAVISSWERSPRHSRLGFAALFVLASVASVTYHGNGAWIFVSAAAGLTIASQRTALRVIGAVAVCYSVTSLTGRDSVTDFLLNLVPTVLVGFAMVGFRRQIELTRELSLARETVAQLAASEERLRLARDMHDLTGQSLSMITLKSELAARLLKNLGPSPERDRARDEIQQVADVSRQTLHDIREAISGYRRPTLAVEIITARSALESAGITPHDEAALTLLSGTFDPDAEAALAWCLREVVTNVVRHSGARNCYISLTQRGRGLSLEVRDDGLGHAAAGRGATHGTAAPPPGEPEPEGHGTGLRGMSERLCAVGGRLELQPGGAGAEGFRLVATVPARQRVTVAE